MRKGKIKSIVLAMSMILGVAGATPVLAAKSASYFFNANRYGIAAYADLQDGGTAKQDKFYGHAMITGTGTGADSAVAYYKFTRREVTWWKSSTIVEEDYYLDGSKRSTKERVWRGEKIGFFNEGVTLRVSSNGQVLTVKD